MRAARGAAASRCAVSNRSQMFRLVAVHRRRHTGPRTRLLAGNTPAPAVSWSCSDLLGLLWVAAVRNNGAGMITPNTLNFTANANIESSVFSEAPVLLTAATGSERDAITRRRYCGFAGPENGVCERSLRTIDVKNATTALRYIVCQCSSQWDHDFTGPRYMIFHNQSLYQGLDQGWAVI